MCLEAQAAKSFYFVAMSAQPITLSVQLFQTESNLMWYHGFNVDEEVAAPFIQGTDRRVICTLPDGTRFHCALFPSKMGGYNILINKERRNKLGLRTGEVFEVTIEKDTTPYGAPMSDEFRIVMEEDDEANAYFHKLTPGLQRTLIYYSDNVKSSDIRIRRALVVAQHLITYKGKLDYKILAQEIKEANQRAKLR